ncbi:MAG TPA: response regulator transcription factor [Ignavibacteria bacterium]|nr:response regulator transcription factor [Ignavibacteria bacterium]HMR00715.1 response regulator transcription factor [Ignavibacteria bacterium]
MTDKIKLIIADDHHIFRKGILSIVSEDDGIEITGEAANGDDALKLIEEKKPDIAILDIDMPGLSGLDVARKVKSEKLPVKIVILTIHKDKEYFDEALELDIKAYVLKESIANDLIDCIKRVAEGEYYISSAISGYLVEKNKTSPKQTELDKLTNAEKEILKLIAQNKTSAQIADELFRSVRTIENHRNNICNKLGLKGPHALLLYAIQHKSVF